jgi:hypothetical protein
MQSVHGAATAIVHASSSQFTPSISGLPQLPCSAAITAKIEVIRQAAHEAATAMMQVPLSQSIAAAWLSFLALLPSQPSQSRQAGCA